MGSNRKATSRMYAMVALAGLLLITGCSDPNSTDTTPSSPSTAPHESVSPSPLASTAAQENALAAKIPLDGNELVPLHWKLPKTTGTDETSAVLAARRTAAIYELLHAFSDPSAWAPVMYAVEKEPIKTIYDRVATEKTEPWKDRSAGPVWIWVIKIQRISPGTFVIHQCNDHGWQGSVKRPNTEYETGPGRFYKTTVSLLDFPDGKRWKTIQHRVTYGTETARKIYPQCKTWANTHTTTEGWALPPEPTTAP